MTLLSDAMRREAMACELVHRNMMRRDVIAFNATQAERGYFRPSSTKVSVQLLCSTWMPQEVPHAGASVKHPPNNIGHDNIHVYICVYIYIYI